MVEVAVGVAVGVVVVVVVAMASTEEKKALRMYSYLIVCILLSSGQIFFNKVSPVWVVSHFHVWDYCLVFDVRRKCDVRCATRSSSCLLFIIYTSLFSLKFCGICIGCCWTVNPIVLIQLD